jgi:hypothetical protein
MGCDYYIIKFLQIYYGDNECLEIELNRKQGYYIFDEDSDEDASDDDYDARIDDYVKYVLTPKLKPITIYANNNFSKPFFATKYKNLVENEISKTGKNLSEIIKIMKTEQRRER